MTEPSSEPEPTDSFGASTNLHDGLSREFIEQDLGRVDTGPVGPIARFHPPSRDPADRDPEFPTAYRAARWAVVFLISATTMLTAWWLVHAGVIGWLAGLPSDYLSWLPFVD